MARLDVEIEQRGLARSRSRARDLIKRGLVTVEGDVACKPSQTVGDKTAITLAPDADVYVSRSALKLQGGLVAFRFSAKGRIVLDIGASTGGFTQVLLEDGAERVYAVDVGHDQLAGELRENSAVVVLEGLDARALTTDIIPEPIDALTADVSFISLNLVLDAALKLMAPGSWMVALIKPQFEVGRSAIGKGGIVRDEVAIDAALARVEASIDQRPGWQVTGIIPSPIRGQSGNQEYLIGARFDG